VVHHRHWRYTNAFRDNERGTLRSTISVPCTPLSTLPFGSMHVAISLVRSATVGLLGESVFCCIPVVSGDPSLALSFMVRLNAFRHKPCFAAGA
jgi:hypothetical protein